MSENDKVDPPAARDVTAGPLLSRRVVLAGAGALLGCSGTPGGVMRTLGQDAVAPNPLPDAVSPPRPPGLDAGAVEVSGETAPEARPPALSDDELLAAIDTVVVLCMENRSFDQVFGARSLLEGRPVDGITREMKNVARDGREIFVNPLDRFSTPDPPHTWDPVHRQWNEGAMDGFAREFGDVGVADVMGYYGRAQLPVSWALADHFVTCDRWFSSVLGATWPNRLYLHGASSNGVRENLPTSNFTSIFTSLTEAKLSHANYFVDIPWAAGGYLKTGGNLPIERFFSDAASGKLPVFSVVDPGFFGAAANDDHPAHDVRLGQAFINTVYNAVRFGPQWNRCLFVVIYDEHGGFFDHVPPPQTLDARPEFRQLGMRVPALVAGGVVRRGQTISQVFDHVSIIATLTKRFALTPLNPRVAVTAHLAACIDPALVGHPQPGPELPLAPPINMARLAQLDASTRGVRPTQHTELWDLAQTGRIPGALDRRAQALAITRHWLRVGADLGALRLL
jgi:phospholipase C